jgi:HlyD family secretion protein
MRNKILFIISGLGLLLAIISAYIFAQQPKAQPPLFSPAANPYGSGVYAEGLIESAQAQGENINIYPEVPGPITQVLVSEGHAVHKGDPLLRIDDSVQRATTEQLRAQYEAAQAVLSELKAQPRPEALAVAVAQVQNAQASLKTAADALSKQQHSYDADPRSISMDALDTARNAQQVAATNLQVVQRQYELTRAGAWIYDVQNQERQVAALSKAYAAAAALLDKYSIKAPADGTVLVVQTGVGSFVSTQGAYDSYTQGYDPLITMATAQDTMEVRAYIDEILVDRLPEPAKIKAQMFIRGTDVHVPLTFTRIQPLISPKIELSDQRRERVDVRVLPVIFHFVNARNLHLYPGELVDVYVGAQ